jgi:hypothetical protein
MKMHSSTMIIAVLFTLLSVSPAFPNDAPVKSVGKTIQPMNNVPVRMVSEDVRISLSSTKADVHCLFTLRNEGKPETIEVGFPRGWEGDLIGFTAKDAHIPGVFSVETMAEQPFFGEFSDEKLPWWKVFKVPFTSTGQSRVIENYYSTFLLPWGKYPVPWNDLLFTYIMKTGALWKGQIDSAKVTLYLRNIPFDQVTKISPEGYIREENRITWNFRNFEPAKNIEISIIQDAFYERESIARKILETDPNNAYAHYLIGTVYFNRRFMDDNQILEAEKELQKAINLDSKLWDAQWFLALVYIDRDVRSKIFKDSKTQLGKIVRENPDYRCTDKLFYQSELIQYDNPKGLLESLISLAKMNNWK